MSATVSAVLLKFYSCADGLILSLFNDGAGLIAEIMKGMLTEF
jgi:hypothetical protein